ncbi:MAG: CHAT domain-containing protein [Chitinophagaceae bacterium]|jgi:CHAT domain-containing protein|nr:CHAT domain-containing protein [Chitinophagaceae bacterium]
MKKQTGLTSFYFRHFISLLLISPLFIAFKSAAQSEKISRIKTLEKEMIAAYYQKDFDRIFNIGDSALVIAPANKRILGSCFDIAWNQQKDTSKALHYLKIAVEQHPFDKYFVTNYSWLLLLNGQVIKALPVCTKAYHLDRSSVSAIINYAHSMSLMGIKTLASELYEEAMALTTSMDAYLQSQDADYEILHTLYTDAGFDSIRSAEKKKMQAALTHYANANKLYNDFEAKNIKGKSTKNEIITILNAGLEVEKKQTPQRLKRISKYLTTLGNTIYNTGQVKTAIKNYLEAIPINLQLKDYAELGKIYYNVGVIYKNIRTLDSAYYYFDGAAYYYSMAGEKLDEAGAYDAMAMVLNINGEMERALPIIKDKVIPLMEKYNAYEDIIDAYLFMSDYYRDKKQEDSVQYYLEKCVETASINSVVNEKLVTLYNQLAVNASRKKDFSTAKAYQLMVVDAIPESEYMTLRNLQALQGTGVIYYAEKNYDSAKYYFEKAIEILNTIRGTLPFDEKLRFLSANSSLFNYLALCHYHLGNQAGVFDALEESRSLVLLEKMGGMPVNKISLAQLQQKMKDDELYLLTYFSNPDDTFSEKLIMSIDKYTTQVKLMSDSTFIFGGTGAAKTSHIDTMFTNFQKSWQNPTDSSENKFLKKTLLIFAVYMQLELAKASDASRGLKPEEKLVKISHSNNARAIGSAFYQALIKPFEKQLVNKKKIIIIPDGQLSFVPFEILPDDNGKHLTEKYTISYQPSIKVADLLAKRQKTYTGTKVVLLGNPVYAELTDTDLQLGARPAYRSAEAYQWNYLPETKTEIDSISKYYKEATVLTNVDCTEEKFKSLFTSTTNKYALVHFATHGHVIDNDPGLSSVILNQLSGKRKEDGYLTANEIEKMKIPAQLVVLSACQTGKGMLMQGEGVQGLSSSFMVAGANSLIVSLWSVADKSTRIFMQEVYKIVNKEGLSFKAAIQKVKGFFIAGKFGEEYQKPYYWAPFIYIGN